MRFLIDRCAGRRLTNWLLSQGHDAVYSADLGQDPGDRALLGLAAEQKRIFVTIDTDFARLVFVEKQSHCGIVRLPDVPAQKRIDLAAELLRRHETDLVSGAIITIRGGRIRISHAAAGG